MIDFKILLTLANEVGEEHPIEATIGYLAMSDIPMTSAVIALGIASGVLTEEYSNGWSENLDI